MKCPECLEQGLKSKVWIQSQASTLLAGNDYWDEEGRLVRAHSFNTLTTWYKCSEGHSWTVAGKQS